MTILQRADANAAVLHALGLLCAHALHYLAMLAENRQHAIRTVGPKGVLSGSLMEAEGTRGTMLWAVLQVLRCPACPALCMHCSHSGLSKAPGLPARPAHVGLRSDWSRHFL